MNSNDYESTSNLLCNLVSCGPGNIKSLIHVQSSQKCQSIYKLLSSSDFAEMPNSQPLMLVLSECETPQISALFFNDFRLSRGFLHSDMTMSVLKTFHCLASNPDHKLYLYVLPNGAEATFQSTTVAFLLCQVERKRKEIENTRLIKNCKM